ncbi:MAG: ATPase [Reyranella sp.]|uniref:AAA family ATPase n=1 Tax=Reyranella sp. TaxID=1929291 RepID=UPI0012264534|nr:AAA family ATPase [Reyranella sp.]TAJ96381.1 MAG: ATPase [Reyranella sp.]TBR25195.1 MAG: ATPase [Reyranella sp.]
MTGRFILTGAPGAGKTAVVRQLELEDFAVVEEAATDVIALEQAKGVTEPWTDPGFIDRIVALQRQRRLATTGDIQFHDRSAFCTEALATFLGHPLSGLLRTEIEDLKGSGFYQRRVFFVRLMGFIEPTAARRIGLEDARRFEAVHERVYRAHGFELVPVEPGSVVDRAGRIRHSL